MSGAPTPKVFSSIIPAPFLEQQQDGTFSVSRQSEITHQPRAPFVLTPEQLYLRFTDSYDRCKHAEQTVVRSAWYGKAEASVKHEFIVLQVEDLATPGHTNCLLLDRTIGNTSGDPSIPHSRRTTSFFRLCVGTFALDAFWISYEPNPDQLLRDCNLSSYKCLEQIHFQLDEPLWLYEVATLAYCISKRWPRYHPLDGNCYWYTGLIWKCIRRMRPNVDYEDHAAKERGVLGWILVCHNPFHIRAVLREARQRVLNIESKFPSA